MAYNADRMASYNRRLQELRADRELANRASDSENRGLINKYGIKQTAFGSSKEGYEAGVRASHEMMGAIEKRTADLQRERQEAAFEDAYSYRPQALQMEAVSGNPETEQMKNAMARRIGAQAQASRGQATSAMQRQFARLGGLNSGAAIKAQAVMNQQSQEQENEALANTFADIDFKTAEAARSRNAARQQFNSDQDFKAAVFRADAASKLGAMDMAFNQFDWAKFTDQQTIAQNAQMVENSKPTLLDEIGKAATAVGSIVAAPVTGGASLGGLLFGGGGKKKQALPKDFSADDYIDSSWWG